MIANALMSSSSPSPSSSYHRCLRPCRRHYPTWYAKLCLFFASIRLSVFRISPATRESWGWCSCANRSWCSLQQNLGTEITGRVEGFGILRSNFHVQFLNSFWIVPSVLRRKKPPSRQPTWLQQAITLCFIACKLSNLTMLSMFSMFSHINQFHLPKIVSEIRKQNTKLKKNRNKKNNSTNIKTLKASKDVLWFQLLLCFQLLLRFVRN